VGSWLVMKKLSMDISAVSTNLSVRLSAHSNIFLMLDLFVFFFMQIIEYRLQEFSVALTQRVLVVKHLSSTYDPNPIHW